MNQAQKDQWLTDLRSGEYVQGRRFLKHNENYCCLGVFADRQYVQGGVGRWRDSSRNTKSEGTVIYQTLVYPFHRSGMFLPEDVISMVTQAQLANLNDDGGRSFGEIADWIEQNVEVDD